MTSAIHIEIAGCAFNVSDSEAMAGTLVRAGYQIAPTPADADLVILNTCTVKDKTFREFRKRLEKIRQSPNGEATPRVIVAGCIPKSHAGADFLRDVSTLGPDAVGRVDEVARETLRGHVVHLLNGGHGTGRSNLPVLRRNPVVEILPIARGCRSVCAFCQTRLARGRLASFPPEEILAQARRALAEGVREFWVTAQDAGAYGEDSGYPLPRLLERLLELEGNFKVRLGMSSPQWIARRLEEYLRLFEHPKMFRFLHVPIQSGSDRVLREMKREGDVAQFALIHDEFIRRYSDGCFVTDLIVGYPTESEEDFEQTLNLVEHLNLGFVNISKFSPRPGTSAAQLKPLPSAVISRRSRILSEQVRRVAARSLAAYRGRRFTVLIEQILRNGMNLGRTRDYRPVIVDGKFALGDEIDVEITAHEDFHLMGEEHE